MRLIFVDTETTGISPIHGHRIIEIACIETVDGQLTGREFHHLINPDRQIPFEASQIHGIHDGIVQDKPFFSAIADELMAFVSTSKVFMHNATFDVDFFRAEFERLRVEFTPLTCLEAVTDTLPYFRNLHPETRWTLSALCERHGIQLSEGEDWHGALAEARMLARLWHKCTSQLPEAVPVSEGIWAAVTSKVPCRCSLIGVAPAQQAKDLVFDGVASDFGVSLLLPDLTFATLAVGKSNHFAHAISQDIVSQVVDDQLALHSPFILYGAHGVGKSHVINAIANEVLQKAPDRVVRSIHTMNFINDVRKAYLTNSLERLRHIYQDVDLLCLDDLNSLSSSALAQQVLCQICDGLITANAHLVISSSIPLAEIEWFEIGLVSKLRSSLSATINPPDLDLRVRILQRMADINNFNLDDDAAHFIANSIDDGNVRVLVGVLMRAAAYSLFHNCRISVDIASKLVQERALWQN